MRASIELEFSVMYVSSPCLSDKTRSASYFCALYFAFARLRASDSGRLVLKWM